MLTIRARGRHVGEVAPSAEACARQILDLVPRAMRFLRQEMRSGRGAGLSVPQFRVLAYLARNPGASLSTLAGFIGISGPTASTMVGRLVRRGLVRRSGDPTERRRVMLTATPAGSTLLERSRARARARVTDRLRVFSEAQLRALADGLALLEGALGPSVGNGANP